MKVVLLCLAFTSVGAAKYKVYEGKNSYKNHGGVEIDSDSSAPTGLSVDTCEARCDSDATCDCITFSHSDGKCWKRSACVSHQFGNNSRYTTYVKANGYVLYPGTTCYHNHGGAEIDNDDTALASQTPDSCKAICDADDACDCVSFRPRDGKCWRRSSCVPSGFGSDSNFDTYVKKGGPTPTPVPPTPSPHPPAPSPTPAPGRLGSFIVIGDWGHDDHHHGNCYTSKCQKEIARTMHETMAELGDVKFIINVGDSFYPKGVSGKDDPQWDAKWRNVYSQELRSVPWYSVYGNHDYHQDPGVCSDNIAHGAQINGDIDDLTTFYMPGYNWYKEHPELELEVVALDLNHYQNGWCRHKNCQKFSDCQYTKCESDCYGRIEGRAEEGFKLFKQRAAATSAKNLLVFSHYPTDYFGNIGSSDPSSDFLDRLSDASKFHVEFFGGHRHNVNHQKSISPNSAWLVGGGGGWSCDGNQQGFVVGEIASDGTLTTRSALVDPGLCCSRFLSNNASQPKEIIV